MIGLHTAGVGWRWQRKPGGLTRGDVSRSATYAYSLSCLLCLPMSDQDHGPVFYIVESSIDTETCIRATNLQHTLCLHHLDVADPAENLPQPVSQFSPIHEFAPIPHDHV